MVTVQSTQITCTYLKGVGIPTFDTTSASYVDVTGSTLASVPNGSKIYFNFFIAKSVGGTMDIRITDGTNVFYEETGVTSDAGTNSFDGTIIQNSGSAQNIKVQILSSDGNTASVKHDVNGGSWMVACDMSGADPIVISPNISSSMSGPLTFKLNGKRQIDTIFGICAPAEIDSTSEPTALVSGLFCDNLRNGGTEKSFELDLNVITNEIDVFIPEGTINWSQATTNRGRAAVIIAYSGYNIEVTG